METVNEMNINVDNLCVLKFSEDSGRIIVDYEQILHPLDNDFENLKMLFVSEHKDAKTILAFVKRHPKLNILLEQYNYCRHLSLPYQGIYADIATIEAKYPSHFPLHLTANARDELKKNEKENLLFDLQERLQAFYLASAYVICEQKGFEKSILAYSHRKVGWGTPQYNLNQNFSIELKTNFGYGNNSYFYTRIKYKGIDVIPFSDWIVYEQAFLFEIINYSAKHELDNESWIEALEYSRDACNLSLTDEIAFVRKYIVEELERMVTGVEDFLKGDKFKFMTLQKISTDVHKAGHNLIEFRGEKLSGALNFIEKIVQFDKIAEINEFVIRIKNCNKKVQPMLVKEIILIDKELIDLDEILIVLKPEFEILDKENNDFNILKNHLREQMIRNKEFTTFKFDLKELDARFKEEYTEYKTFEIHYQQKKQEFENLNAQILSLETTATNIEEYNSRITTFLNASEN